MIAPTLRTVANLHGAQRAAEDLVQHLERAERSARQSPAATAEDRRTILAWITLARAIGQSVDRKANKLAGTATNAVEITRAAEVTHG